MKTQKKFYLADTSFRYSVLGYNENINASSPENIVYSELSRRGYKVNISKTHSGEIDFVATTQNNELYAQVTQEIRTEKTATREYERFLEIQDHYPICLLTSDFAGGNYEGIKSRHVADFLLSRFFDDLLDMVILCIRLHNLAVFDLVVQSISFYLLLRRVCAILFS